MVRGKGHETILEPARAIYGMGGHARISLSLISLSLTPSDRMPSPDTRHTRLSPYALTPNTVELILTLGALPPRGGPVQDPVLTFLASDNGPLNTGSSIGTRGAMRVFSSSKELFITGKICSPLATPLALACTPSASKGARARGRGQWSTV